MIKERFVNGPKNAKYSSPNIQNTLTCISVRSTTVQDSIYSFVCKAGANTILVDEAKDCSEQEQLAIVM